MDMNSQTPQPPQKQSLWAKLFGGGKKDTPAPVAPTTPPPAADATVAQPDSDMSTSFSAPDTMPATESPVVDPVETTPMPGADVLPASDSTMAPAMDMPTSSPAPDVEQVPQEDVSKVDEALNALPPLPVAADEPPTMDSLSDVPQPPVDPMVTPAASADTPAATSPIDDQTPSSPLNP